MRMILIRQATSEDAQLLSSLSNAVQHLHAEALPERFKPPSEQTWPVEEVREVFADESNVIYIAECENQPAGYIYCTVKHREESAFTYARSLVYINHLSVEVAWQKRGVGSALMDAVKQLAEKHNIDELALDTWAFNEKALAFFHKQNFTIQRHILSTKRTEDTP